MVEAAPVERVLESQAVEKKVNMLWLHATHGRKKFPARICPSQYTKKIQRSGKARMLQTTECDPFFDKYFGFIIWFAWCVESKDKDARNESLFFKKIQKNLEAPPLFKHPKHLNKKNFFWLIQCYLFCWKSMNRDGVFLESGSRIRKDFSGNHTRKELQGFFNVMNERIREKTKKES